MLVLQVSSINQAVCIGFVNTSVHKKSDFKETVGIPITF